MKYSVFSFLFIFIFSGCTSYEEHKYFGQTPSIAMEYSVEIENLQHELTRITDIEKGRNLSLKILKLKDEADEKIRNNFNSFDIPVELPFIQNAEKDYYEIKSVRIKKISYNRIDFIAKVEAKVDSKNPLFSYLKFTDDKGSEIPGWVIFISPMNIKKSRVYQVEGSYEGIENLVNAHLLKVKPRRDIENITEFSN